MRLVVDSSFVVASLLAEEHTGFALEVLGAGEHEESLAPALLPFEVANVLRTRFRSGDLSASERDARLAGFAALGIMIEPPPSETRLARSLDLSARHDLTVYDAAYLETALRLGGALATLDKTLIQAARAARVDVVTP